MKHTRWLFLLLVLALPAVSCNTPEPEPEKVTVSVNPASLDFEQGGGTASLTVTSNGLWYARSEGSWISLSPSSGSGNATVQVTAAPNSGDARTAGNVVETSDQKATVTVSQNRYVAPQPKQKTLREIRALYPGKDYTITDDFFVEGLVISDYRRDTDGGLNNYTSAKTIIISDGDAGLMLYCKADNKTFARGQRVRVDLRNQVLSVYADGAIQVNGLPLENITYLGTEKPQAKEITVEQLLSGQYECTYVAVKEVQVRQEFVGKAFYTAADKGSVGFEGRSGGQFDLFTSQYAVFGADIVPSGSGNLKGIAGSCGENCTAFCGSFVLRERFRRRLVSQLSRCQSDINGHFWKILPQHKRRFICIQRFLHLPLPKMYVSQVQVRRLVHFSRLRIGLKIRMETPLR